MNLEKNKIIINEVLEKLEKEKDYCMSEKPLYNIGRFGFSIVTLQSCFGTIYIYNLSKVLSYNLNIAPFLGMFTVLSGIGVTCFGLKVRDINYKINYLNYELEKYMNKNKVLEILEGAFDHMNDDGTLYFVIRKDQGALSIKKILESTKRIEIINKDKGYFIFRVKKIYWHK